MEAWRCGAARIIFCRTSKHWRPEAQSQLATIYNKQTKMKSNQKGSSGSPTVPCSPKIWRVEISYEIYVLAENERLAVDAAHEGVGDEEPEVECATEVKTLDEIPTQWRDALPYGGTSEKSIRTIYAENAEESHAAKKSE